MIKSKWIRRALLGGVAMAVMASGAQAADDLEALKAQIEALQARVNAIEAKGVNLPEGVSLITFQRGAKEIKMVSEGADGLLDKAPESRGFTIAITPTADLPAPTTEITIGGQVRAVALWGREKIGGVKDNDFDLQARGQLNIRSRTDTAIGQIRTEIELRYDWGDLSAGADAADGGAMERGALRARKAYGEWDFMPGWTLLAGRQNKIAHVANVSYGTIPAQWGLDVVRANQIRLTYNGGPITFGFGIEDPSTDNLGSVNTTTMPDFAGFAQFNAPMGISLRVTGEAGKVGSAAGGTDTGFLLGVGTAMSFDMFSLNAGFIYTKGLGCDGLFSAAGGYCRVGTAVPGSANTTGRLAKAYGFQVNAGMNMTETVSANASFGYFNYTNLVDPNDWDHGFSTGGNIVWRPVDAFQAAAEVDYFKAKQLGGTKGSALYGGIAFWFFF